MGEPLMLLPASALVGTTVKQRGHAMRPGTGPEGETCHTCKHLTQRRMSKTYTKCGLVRAAWTGGAGTDIRHSDPACGKWEKK